MEKVVYPVAVKAAYKAMLFVIKEEGAEKQIEEKFSKMEDFLLSYEDHIDEVALADNVDNMYQARLKHPSINVALKAMLYTLVTIDPNNELKLASGYRTLGTQLVEHNEVTADEMLEHIDAIYEAILPF